MAWSRSASVAMSAIIDARTPVVELRATCLQQPRVAVDRGHRRPQLVRDEPEEGVLDRVGCLERTGGTLPVGDVDQDVDRADQLPVIREQGRRVGGERHLAAVGPDRDGLAAANGSGLVEGDRHRALVVTHRRTRRARAVAAIRTTARRARAGDPRIPRQRR